MLDKNHTKIYKKLYNLAEFTSKEKVNFDFFKLCKKDYRFIIICIYNKKGEILLLRDFNKNIGWELTGGYIKESEEIEDAANRIVLEETGLTTDELQPIALVKNIFEYETKVIEHCGIAFIAAIRGRIKPQPDNKKIFFTKEINEKIAYQNRTIFDEAKRVIKNNIFKIPYEEIDSVKAFFPCYIFNKYFVKILSRAASKKIRKSIIKIISGNPRKIMDVSCGDDKLIIELEKIYNPDICVGNDISWKTISLIKKGDKNQNVIFTNHNILNLPFKETFDLVIFKNTLHHIPDSEQENFIKELINSSKQLIIIDIEDPAQSNFLTKLWHWYYVHILNDQGKYFLTFKTFKKIIEKNAGDRKLDFGITNTVKGKYFYASILKSDEVEEVEIKIKIDELEMENAIKKLKTMGANFVEEIREKDIYFTALHRDFIKTKECLRIRERNDFSELTYKGPTTELMENKRQFWKPEINLNFNSNAEEIKKLLECLGFIEVAKVDKKRKKFTLGKQEIVFDKIENLGYFVEIENTAQNSKEREKALKENMKLLKELGLSEGNIVSEPYRDLVLKTKQ